MSRHMLLFTPSMIEKGKSFFSFLSKSREGRQPRVVESSFGREQFSLLNDNIPFLRMNTLLPLTHQQVLQAYKEAEQGVRDKATGLPLQQAAKEAWWREMRSAFARALTTLVGMQVHHRRFHGQKATTSACRFSDEVPSLRFRVKQEAGFFRVQEEVLINRKPLPEGEWRRTQFLVECRDTYYLLGSLDYRTLYLLQLMDPQGRGMERQAFEEGVLSLLHDYRYPVERDDEPERTEIRAEPVSRVQLSEISNAFLMLTPMWDYDGFLVEGVYKPYEDLVRGGVFYRVYRDEEKESAFARFLEALHPGFARQLNGYFHISFAEAQKNRWFMKTFHALLTADVEITGTDMLKHFRYSPEPLQVQLKLLTQGEREAELQMEIRFGREPVSLAELQKVLMAGQHAIVLKDGRLGMIDDDFYQRYAVWFRHGKVKGKNLRLPRWLAHFEEDKREEPVLRGIIPEDWWERWSRWQREEGKLYEVPAGVQAGLRGYQQKGYDWMRLMAEAGAGGMLADDMGLGKTLQTICFLAARLEEDPAAVHLVVCPASLLYNWKEELERFAPGLGLGLYHGPGRDPAAFGKEGVNVWISSYGTVRSDIEEMEKREWDTVILDESHNIKNPAALTTRAMYRLRARAVFVLSGTPVMNNCFDLYAQFQAILPGFFGSREHFKREYANPIQYGKDEEKVMQLKKITAPFLLRRSKEQVAPDLPEKTELVLPCSMYPGQRQLYEELKARVRSSLFPTIAQQGMAQSRMAVLEGLLRLRQACNSPELLPAEEQQGCRDSVKTDVLLSELGNTLAGRKVLVFSQFTSMLDLLARRLEQEGMDYFLLEGGTPPARRMEMVKNFQEAEGGMVFLISLKAGNAGLNLTAADYVFLFDPWWNEAVQQQAIDRTHRIGQTRQVFAYKMICRDSIEEKILQLQEKKGRLSHDLITAEEGFVQGLTREDVEWLFG